MRLRELYAKGLSGRVAPVAIPFDGSFAVVELEPVVIAAAGLCLEALLYPVDADPSLLHEVAADESSFECGLILRVGEHELRLRRGLRSDSLELQMVDPSTRGFVTRARGTHSVEAVLRERLGRPPVERFRWIHLGGSAPADDAHTTADPLALDSGLFGAIPSESPSSDPLEEWLKPTSLAMEARRNAEEGRAETGPTLLPNPLDDMPHEPAAPRSSEEIARLRTEYRRALAVEALEDSINDVRRRLFELAPDRSGLADDPALSALRDELGGAPPVEVSDEELAILRAPEARMADYERRKTTLEASIDEAAGQLRGATDLWRYPAFVIGTILAVLCTVVSIVGGPGLRVVALGNVGCLAGSLAGVLQFLRARDDLKGQRQRLLVLEEALADLVQERDTYERELASARRRFGVKTAEELEAMRQKRRELQEAQHQARLDRDAQHAEQWAERADERAELESELERREAERAELGDCPLASFQIAQELRNLGLSPDGTEPLAERALTGPAGAVGAVSSIGSWITDDAPPPPLFEHASDLGLIGDDGLDAGSRRLWGRMLAALLNRRLAPPNLTADGGIELSDETGLVWSTLVERERALVIESACIMLLLRGMGRPGSPMWPWTVRLDPYAGHTHAEVERLERLYSRIAQHVQVLVLDSGRREASA